MFAAGKIYFNEDDINTSFLEAEFGSFQMDIEASKDDHIDALAYQLHFIRGRSFGKKRKVRKRNLTVS